MTSEKEAEKKRLIYKIPPYLWAAILLAFVALSTWFFGVVVDYWRNQSRVKPANLPVYVIFSGENQHLKPISQIVVSMLKNSRHERKLDIQYSMDDAELTELLEKRKDWDFVVLEVQGNLLLNQPVDLLERMKKMSSQCKKKGARVVLLVLPIEQSFELSQNSSLKLKQEVVTAMSRRLAQRLGILIAPAAEGLLLAQEMAKSKESFRDNNFNSELFEWTAATSLYCVLAGQSPTELNEIPNLNNEKVEILDATKHYINSQVIKQNQGYDLGLEKSRMLPTGVINDLKLKKPARPTL